MSGESGQAPSRHTNKTNSVTAAEAQNGGSGERDLPTPGERVAEFREAYGERSRLPLTERPGQRLRTDLTAETWAEVPVEPVFDEDEKQTVHELRRRHPLTWEAAVEDLLESYERARKTTLRLERGYEDDPEHEVYHKPAENSWMPSYQKRYFAELKGWVREALGGTRPSGGDCDGEFENPYVVLLTRTASSRPDGERVSPVDHMEEIRSAWEPVYHTLRNRLRSLGFDSSEWDYYRKEEPHKSERGGGMNTCYTHEHTFLVVDGEVTAEDFAPVMEKHVEVCEWAGPDAHTTEGAVEVLPANEIEDVAAYVASYTGIQPAGLLERSIEYVAWGATKWAANRRQRTRSNAAGWAATADACKQRYESDKSEQEVNHGEEIVVSDRRGVEYECRECGSPWGIDQDHDTLTSARLSADDGGGGEAVADGGTEIEDREQELRERWPSARAAATVGVPPSEHKKLDAIRDYLDRNPRASVPSVLGACRLSPEDADLVRQVQGGVDHGEPVGFDRPPDWRLDAIIVEDKEHPAGGSGGVDMSEVKLPVKRLLEETRLQYHGEEQSPIIIVHAGRGDADYVASYNAQTQAERLVEMGLATPWAAEACLEFEQRGICAELKDCFID